MAPTQNFCLIDSRDRRSARLDPGVLMTDSVLFKHALQDVLQECEHTSGVLTYLIW